MWDHDQLSLLVLPHIQIGSVFYFPMQLSDRARAEDTALRRYYFPFQQFQSSKLYCQFIFQAFFPKNMSLLGTLNSNTDYINLLCQGWNLSRNSTSVVWTLAGFRYQLHQLLALTLSKWLNFFIGLLGGLNVMFIIYNLPSTFHIHYLAGCSK